METNIMYSEKNELFKGCCKKARCKPTSRQASKFKRGLGIAYKVSIGDSEPLQEGMGGYLAPEK